MADKTKQSNDPAKSFWNVVAETYYKKRYAGSRDTCSFGLSHRKEIVEMLLSQYGPTSGNCIDFGCGPAVLFDAAEKQGLRYFGIDISEKMIRQGRQIILEASPAAQPVLLVGDVTDTSLPESYFEVALAQGIIEYLNDEEKFYQEVHRVLKKGGIAIITYPNKHSYYNYLRAVIKPMARITKPQNKVLGSGLQVKSFQGPRELEKLSRLGFKVMSQVYYGAQLIPVGLSMPNCYFRILPGLEKVFQKCHFSFGLSGFILVVTKDK